MKMRNALIAAGSAIALSAIATASLAGTVSANAVATATILSPVTITKTQDMAFGQIVRPSNASPNTVVLNTSDTVSLTGAGNGSLIASPTTSAKFNISSVAATTYTLTTTLTFTTAGLTGVAPGTPVATSGTLGTIPAGGTQEIRFGGQFDIDATTPPATYTGTLAVTVNYS